MNDRQLFLQYLRHGRIGLAITALCLAVYTIIFILYELPLAALLYPTALCLIIAVIYVIFDFISVRRRCILIRNIAQQGSDALSLLPEPEYISDTAYTHLITQIADEYSVYKTETRKQSDAENEYFTLWAHQIKTPLASMRLNLSAEDSQLSRQLNTDLIRTEQYVDMVMAYLRLGAFSNDLLIKECSLDDILRGAARKFAPEFISRHLTLDMETTEKTVLTDEKWLSFVVEQLLSNALKYTAHGGIKIYLEKPLTLTVADSGIGIPKEDLPLIFEKGYTGVSGRTDRHSSGIGLWLCKRICDMLGHRITAVSPGADGIGTEMKIDLEIHHIDE